MSLEGWFFTGLGLGVVGFFCVLALALAVVGKLADELSREVERRWKAKDLPRVEAGAVFHVETVDGEEVWQR